MKCLCAGRLVGRQERNSGRQNWVGATDVGCDSNNSDVWVADPKIRCWIGFEEFYLTDLTRTE